MDEQEEKERIIRLAQSFHAIADHPAVLDWDPIALDQWAVVASHGERLAVQFVLGVWNQYYPYECGRFDVIEATTVWDDDHWKAFAAWAADPFTL